MKTSTLSLLALMISSTAAMAVPNNNIIINSLTTAFGGDNTINLAEIAAGQTISGGSNYGNGTTIYLKVGGIEIPTTVNGSAWSVIVDDGTSGAPGATDISSLTDGAVSVTASPSSNGPVEASSGFTLDRLAALEEVFFRYEPDLPLPWRFAANAPGIEATRVFTLLITDSLNQPFSASMNADPGNPPYVWLDTDLAGLADGPATYVISATDAAGNPASVSGAFTIDMTATTTLVLNSPSPGYVSNSFPAALFSFSGTATSVEGGRRVALDLTDTAGHRLHGITTVDLLGNWMIPATSLAQAPTLTVVHQNPVGHQSQGRPVDVAVLKSGGYVATWMDVESSSDRIAWRRVLPDGTPTGTIAYVREGPGLEEVTTCVCALMDGGWVIGFVVENSFETLYQRYDSTGEKVGGAVTVSSSPGGSVDVVALPDGGWVILYQDFTGHYLQRYDSAGSLVAGPVLVASASAASPKLALLDGSRLVLAYSVFGGLGDGNDSEIVTQAFDAAGTSIAGPVKVDAPDADEDFAPAVAGLADGGWIVTWTAIGGEGDGPDREVLFQRYDATGAAVGGNVQVDGPDSENDGFPVVAGLPDGGWAIVWSEAHSDDGSAELSYRLYTSAGGPRGPAAYFGSRWPNPGMNASFFSAIDTFPDGSFVHFHVTDPECRANFLRPSSNGALATLDGSVTAEVVIRDEAGNLATASLPVTFDFPTAFRFWAMVSGLTVGVNDGALDDPNLDGVPNILHFAFDTSPLGSGGDEGKRVNGFIDLPGGRYFFLTLPVRKGAVFTGAPNLCAIIDGVVYQVQGSVDLQTWAKSVSELPAAVAGLPPLRDIDDDNVPDWEYRSFILNDASLSSGFLRGVIQSAP